MASKETVATSGVTSRDTERARLVRAYQDAKHLQVTQSINVKALEDQLHSAKSLLSDRQSAAQKAARALADFMAEPAPTDDVEKEAHRA